MIASVAGVSLLALPAISISQNQHEEKLNDRDVRSQPNQVDKLDQSLNNQKNVNQKSQDRQTRRGETTGETNRLRDDRVQTTQRSDDTRQRANVREDRTLDRSTAYSDNFIDMGVDESRLYQADPEQASQLRRGVQQARTNFDGAPGNQVSNAGMSDQPEVIGFIAIDADQPQQGHQSEQRTGTWNERDRNEQERSTNQREQQQERSTRNSEREQQSSATRSGQRDQQMSSAQDDKLRLRVLVPAPNTGDQQSDRSSTNTREQSNSADLSYGNTQDRGSEMTSQKKVDKQHEFASSNSRQGESNRRFVSTRNLNQGSEPMALIIPAEELREAIGNEPVTSSDGREKVYIIYVQPDNSTMNAFRSPSPNIDDRTVSKIWQDRQNERGQDQQASTDEQRMNEEEVAQNSITF
jgi:hypothetical protein